MRGKKSETMTSALTLQLRSFTFEQLETMDARRMNTCQDHGIVVSHIHTLIRVCSLFHARTEAYPLVTFVCARAFVAARVHVLREHAYTSIQVAHRLLFILQFPSVMTTATSQHRLETDAKR